MKIIDYDGRLKTTIYNCKEFANFIKEYRYENLYFDKNIISNALLEKTLGSIDTMQTKVLDVSNNRIYNWSELGSISFNTKFISDLCRKTNTCGAHIKDDNGTSIHLTMGLSEYLFWEKINLVHNNSENYSDEEQIEKAIVNHFVSIIESYKGSFYKQYGYLYTYNMESIPTVGTLLKDFAFYINSKDNLSMYAEKLKTYLFPIINKDINFVNILKALTKYKGLSKYQDWERSGLYYSKDPEFFKFVFNSIKRKTGYVQEKRKVIDHAIDSGVIDKKLFALFIKKSTITIRRSIADYFSERSSSLETFKQKLKYLISYYDKEDFCKKEESSLYKTLRRYKPQDYEMVELEEYYGYGKDDKLSYLNKALLFADEEVKKVQHGLIAISQEKDYSVQRIVVDYISKENSVWVVPNIIEPYLKRRLNEKMVGV